MGSREAIPRAADPRPERTRAALFEAARRLAAADKPVTAAAVARESGVSRSAFYLHFDDISDFTLAMLTADMRAIGLADLARRESGGDGRLIALDSLERFLGLLQQGAVFYRRVLTGEAGARALGMIVEISAQQIREEMDRMRIVVPVGVDPGDLARFVSGGSLMLVFDWLRDGCPTDPRQMAERVAAVLPEWVIRGA